MQSPESHSGPVDLAASRVNLRNRQHSPMVLEVSTIVTFGEEGVVTERGHKGASSLFLALGVLI